PRQRRDRAAGASAGTLRSVKRAGSGSSAATRGSRAPGLAARDHRLERDGISVRIEDYGLIGDMEAAALVGRDGAVDWLCLPRFDSPSCFAALLGDERHGRWLLAPAGEVLASSRRYRAGTLVLETEFETAEGA